jgi:hypothetical protein
MDSDLAGKNFGFVHSESDYSDAVVAPAYDYEYSFYYPKMQCALSDMEEDFKFLYKFNPGVFEDVRQQFDINLKLNSTRYNRMHDIFNNPQDKGAEEKFRIVINNLLTMRGTFASVQRSESARKSTSERCM